MLMKYSFAQIFPAFPLFRSSVVNPKFNRNFTMSDDVQRDWGEQAVIAEMRLITPNVR